MRYLARNAAPEITKVSAEVLTPDHSAVVEWHATLFDEGGEA